MVRLGNYRVFVLLAVAGLVIVGALGVGGLHSDEPKPATASGPQYDAHGDLKRPADFRKWVFVGANVGLEYSDDVKAADAKDVERERRKKLGDFLYVYINPEAYDHYAKTGKFPEKTVLLIDAYESKEREKKSIVSEGLYPGEESHFAVAVKNSARPDGGKTNWAYYTFQKGAATAKAHADSACYQCHLDHADDDNVWTQFYPTLRRLKKAR